MKKEYIKPEIELEAILEDDLMSASGPGTDRYVSGTPTQDGTSVDVYDGSEFDPYGGHGQGSDGGGNRAKGSFACWEDEGDWAF